MSPDLLTPLLAAAGHAPAPPTPAAGPSAAEPWLMLGVQIGIGVLVLSIMLCLWRMIRGPHLADRVLAADTMAMLVAGLVIVLAIKLDSAVFFDAAIVVAILGFASTVAFGQYIGARQKFSDDPRPRNGPRNDPNNPRGNPPDAPRDTPRPAPGLHNRPGLIGSPDDLRPGAR